MLSQPGTLQMFTVAEAAKICRCHFNTIRKYIKNEQLEASKIGRAYTISKENLMTFIEKTKKRTA